jgi:hypothetical protein
MSAPAKVFTETFTWFNDKINGYNRPNGYFNWSYLSGQTEPGGYFNYNPTNVIPYGQPGYTPPFAFANTGGVAFGTGWARGADNEWQNITHRPILMKLTKRFLFSACRALGIDPGKPISEENRTSAFVYAAKMHWFKYAPNPSGGIRIDDGTRTTDENGVIRPGSTRPEYLNKLFTGGSSISLNEELAFTSIEQLFYTLGHELIHVSQFKTLAGRPEWLMDELNFRLMLESNANSFVHLVLGGPYQKTAKLDFENLYPLEYNLVSFARYPWIHSFNKPF